MFKILNHFAVRYWLFYFDECSAVHHNVLMFLSTWHELIIFKYISIMPTESIYRNAQTSAQRILENYFISWIGQKIKQPKKRFPYSFKFLNPMKENSVHSFTERLLENTYTYTYVYTHIYFYFLYRFVWFLRGCCGFHVCVAVFS